MQTMSKPASRVLSMLELLQSGQLLNSASLARHMGVDARTIRRYVTHLIDMGVPVQTQRGVDGGYQLAPGHKLPPMMFTADEALALAVGLRAASALGLGGVTPAIASTQAKLLRVLPLPLRQRLADIEAVVSLDVRPSHAPAQAATLLALGSAARMQQTVQIQYQSAVDEASQRQVDVYGLAYRGGAWYAVGHCHLRQDVRIFRVDRVRTVQAVPHSFGKPKAFDMLGLITQSIANLPRTHSIDVLLLVHEADARKAVYAELGSLQTVGNYTRLLAQADDLAWFARELARLPFGFKIRRPVALKRELQKLARHLAEQG
jgi:predicted DNA-binding transcriptional regulator YafY